MWPLLMANCIKADSPVNTCLGRAAHAARAPEGTMRKGRRYVCMYVHTLRSFTRPLQCHLAAISKIMKSLDSKSYSILAAQNRAPAPNGGALGVHTGTLRKPMETQCRRCTSA